MKFWPPKKKEPLELTQHENYILQITLYIELSELHTKLLRTVIEGGDPKQIEDTQITLKSILSKLR